jgi:sugar lactone lactonase YvrE
VLRITDKRHSQLYPATRLAAVNTPTNGVTTLLRADALAGPWQPVLSTFSFGPVSLVPAPGAGEAAFYRLLSAEFPPTAAGFTNLTLTWDTLTTIAGRGWSDYQPLSEWLPAFEGGYATNAELSRPHNAMGDLAGNVFIVDKEAHAIRKVTPEGRIWTVAGTGLAGNGLDVSTPATNVALNNPNGLYVLPEGTIYILDTDNGKIRRLDTNGLLATVVSTGGMMTPGRGLWVSRDEQKIYYVNGTNVCQWTPGGGSVVVASGSSDLGNLDVDPGGRVVFTDRGAHRVFRVETNGSLTSLAGNGTTSGGASGQSALLVGLYRVRGVCFLPHGGFFLATDNGSQIWYVDTAGIAWLFLNGGSGDGNHMGDGGYFRNAGPAISKPRAITLDPFGNLLITENDLGYVRRIRFIRHLTTPP